MKKRVLIFGIGGFVGSYVADEFHRADYEVFGCDLLETSILPAYVQYLVCNLMDVAKVEALCKRVEPTHIVNLAAISSVGHSWKIPQKTVAVNVEGALNILDAAHKCVNTPRILLIGSSEEYAHSDTPIKESYPLDASNPYGLSKILQERFVDIYRDRYGMKIYYVRSFNHTGIGQSTSFVIPNWCIQTLDIMYSRQPGVLSVGNLDVKRDFSHVKDVVRAYRMVIESEDDKTVYNIGSGIAYELRDILQYIIAKSPQKIQVHVDDKFIRANDYSVIQCNHDLITERLGWSPRWTILNAIDDIFSYGMDQRQEQA
mgnify:CR=1 FL=1